MPIKKSFKNFADKTVVTFDAGIIGIIKSNAFCKSNINDSIREMLGTSTTEVI